MRSFTAFMHDHHCFAAAEHAALRALLFTAGLALIVLGLALGVTMIMLPVGVVMAMLGVGAVIASGTKDLPLPPNA